jgi:hypothetical protein
MLWFISLTLKISLSIRLLPIRIRKNLNRLFFYLGKTTLIGFGKKIFKKINDFIGVL